MTPLRQLFPKAGADNLFDPLAVATDDLTDDVKSLYAEFSALPNVTI
jgi:hypothetical protein